VNEREDRHSRPTRRERVGLLEGPLTDSPDSPARPAGGVRFRLRSSVEPLVSHKGELFLLCAGGDDLVIRDPELADRQLVELLAHGEHSMVELMERLSLSSQAVRSKLDALDRAGVLAAGATSPPLDPYDAQRYARQLPYLAEIGDERELQRRLASTHVVVIGCGGLGTWTIAALAAAGVRRLTVVDDDTVELSNLNRQILYGRADVGRDKVEVTEAWLRAFDDRIDVRAVALRVDGPDVIEGLVVGADALVLAADSPPYVLGRWVNDACINTQVPFIAAGQLPPIVKIGPTYVPGRTACFACHERALRRASPAYDAYVDRIQSTPARGATLGPASGMVGTMVAMELMHQFVGRQPSTAGVAVTVDLRTFAMRRESIPRDADCSACKHLTDVGSDGPPASASTA
jgi:bacteriocin biosynthesis cyclodehydratase domain-containing protein